MYIHTRIHTHIYIYIYIYITKLEIRAEQVLHGSGVGGRGGEREVRGRNDPNNVCTCK
jgi:hypothetical protein